MIQINTGDHASPHAGFLPIPARHRYEIRWARSRAQVIARTIPEANTYFRTLPNGRSLSELLADSTVWVNYHSSLTTYGFTSIMFSKETAIAEYACRRGRWTVLATLIHELAHSNGADGIGHDAERAVLVCGLGQYRERKTGVDIPKTPYVPGITG